jgi:hypothetical protein
MKDHWELTILAILGIAALAGMTSYLVAREWFEWRQTGRWFRRYLLTHITPVYGRPDPSRTMGPHAKRNLRVVNGGLR